jgi:hypothetical protein
LCPPLQCLHHALQLADVGPGNADLAANRCSILMSAWRTTLLGRTQRLTSSSRASMVTGDTQSVHQRSDLRGAARCCSGAHRHPGALEHGAKQLAVARAARPRPMESDMKHDAVTWLDFRAEDLSQARDFIRSLQEEGVVDERIQRALKAPGRPGVRCRRLWRTSIARRSPSCASLQFASCSENSAIQFDVSACRRASVSGRELPVAQFESPARIARA